METKMNQKNSLLLNHTVIEDIENGSIFKKDEKNIKAKDFLNVLSEMICIYSHSDIKKSA